MALLVHLLLLLLLTSSAATLAQGQQKQLTDFVYGGCNSKLYQSNSTYARNYNTVISILKQRAMDGHSYFLTSVTDGTDNSTWVYGMYQCRGDLTSDDCNACVEEVLSYYCTKGNRIGMRVQLLGCFYRYENYNFPVLADYDVWRTNCSSQQNSSSLYQADLSVALNMSARMAANNSGYSVATVGSAHALSQCLGYLSPSDCITCLSQSSSRFSTCNTSSSGYFYYTPCFYIFSDNINDLLLSSSSSPSTPSSPAPSPSLSRTLPPAASPSAPINIVISPPSPESKSSRVSASAIAGISVGSASAVFLVVLFCVVCALNRRKSVQSQAPPYPMSGSNNLSNFTVEELKTATQSFNSSNKLGQGGFGIVYKGTLGDGKEVAIKVISPGEKHGKQIDFMNEAKLISTVQHRNLIQLLGFTTDDTSWYLVYEYLPNRSLDLHLFGSDHHREERPLNWRTRFNIITGIARGLSYLHEDSHVHIVHRDIKASNILLDNNLEPKIADFGLARLFADDVSHLTTAVAGTLGYVAPEYAMGGQLSDKVDVYSFGLVTLEIVSGRKVIENDQTHILEWAWDLYERKRVVEAVDRRIKGTAKEWEVERAMHVALLSTQTRPQTRPTMSQIYTMLRSQSTILDLPSRPAIFSMGIFSPSQPQQQLRRSHYMNDGSDTFSTDRDDISSNMATCTSSAASHDEYKSVDGRTGELTWLSEIDAR